MKTFIIISLVVFFILLATQVAISYTTENKTEQQQYRIISSEGAFEIRYYPEAVLASVSMNGSYGSSTGSGFQQLAGYIFGGNETEQKIAMTAPVRMQQNENNFQMSFVMPADIPMDSLPEPLNPGVAIHQSQPVYTASITFGGYTNEKIIGQMQDKLSEILAEKDIRHTGNFEVLGYNPPYQVVNRRNEVIVELVGYSE